MQVVHPPPEDMFDGDGTHLIVGGTGGLGRSMAKYMVEYGARHIVLTSRTGGNPALVEKLKDEIQCPDAEIMVVRCDVSVESDVRQLVKNCGKAYPPICGVIHAPMVLRVSHTSLLL